MSTDTPAQTIYNPWRESLENCISGDNYLRASEYRELIAELDEFYRLRAASPQPTAAPVAELVEALLTAIKAEDRARFHWIACGCGTPEMDRWDAAIEAREKAAEAVRAALSRAPGAGMPNVLS